MNYPMVIFQALLENPHPARANPCGIFVFSLHLGGTHPLPSTGLMKNTYQDLNDEQREAVLHHAGPALILAGAGSGKTRVVTYRLIRLLDELNVSPFNLLAVTFTNKAAQEMRDRVSTLAGIAKTRDLFIGTFHALCLRILKAHADKLGYQPGFT